MKRRNFLSSLLALPLFRRKSRIDYKEMAREISKPTSAMFTSGGGWSLYNLPEELKNLYDGKIETEKK